MLCLLREAALHRMRVELRKAPALKAQGITVQAAFVPKPPMATSRQFPAW
jgi:hypothetical protein